MNLHLRDKTALVTGASRGLGRAIALGLAREGMNLAVCARGADALAAAADEMRAEGAEVLDLALDITDEPAAARLVGEAAERFGRVDVLVGNAGGGHRAPFEETTDEKWRELTELNLHAHLRFARAAIPEMRKAGEGAIVFVSSIYGREAGGPGLSIYNATKSALISAAKIMALELAGEKIRVNTVAPGSIRFPGGSWDRRVKEDPEGMEKFVAENLPIGRFGRAEEIADVVAWLVSPRASLVTGACLNADGGQSRSLI